MYTMLVENCSDRSYSSSMDFDTRTASKDIFNRSVHSLLTAECQRIKYASALFVKSVSSKTGSARMRRCALTACTYPTLLNNIVITINLEIIGRGRPQRLSEYFNWNWHYMIYMYRLCNGRRIWCEKRLKKKNNNNSQKQV